MLWTMMKKLYDKKKNVDWLESCIGCNGINDDIGKAKIFSHTISPYEPLIRAIKGGCLFDVKGFIEIYKKLKDYGCIKDAGFPEDIIENLRNSKFLRASNLDEKFGTIWWLTFQTSGDAFKDKSLTNNFESLLAKNTKGFSSDILENLYNTVIDKYETFFNNCLNIHDYLMKELDIQDHIAYGAGNLKDSKDITEKQVLMRMFSPDFSFNKTIKDGVDKKSVVYAFPKRTVSLCNAIFFYTHKHKDLKKKDIFSKIANRSWLWHCSIQ